MRAVLVLNSSRPPQAFGASLQGTNYKPVLATCDLSRGAVFEPALREVRLPKPQSLGFGHALVKVCVLLRVSAVLPTDGATALALTRLAPWLAKEGVKTLSGRPDLIQLCDDRLHLLRHLQTAVPTGRLTPVSSGWDRPALLRRRYASDESEVRAVLDPGELTPEERSSDRVLEQILQGIGIEVTLVTKGQGVIDTYQSSYLGLPAQTTPFMGPAIQAYVSSAIATLGLDGAATVYLRCDRDGRPLVMDVRPYFMASPTQRTAGHIVEAALDRLFDDPPLPHLSMSLPPESTTHLHAA